MIDKVPDTILPHENALIRLKLKAPAVGTVRTSIPVFTDRGTEPQFAIDTALRVKFNPPALLPANGDLCVKFVAGDASAREIVFEAIEAKGKQPWIRGVSLIGGEDIEVQAVQMTELPEADPILTRRRYIFPLLNRGRLAGRHTMKLDLITGSESSSLKSPVPLFVDVVDPFAIIPDPVVFANATSKKALPRRIQIINRGGAPFILDPIKFDSRVLTVRALSNQPSSVMSVEIAPVAMEHQPEKTEVEFGLGGSVSRKVVVRFENSAYP